MWSYAVVALGAFTLGVVMMGLLSGASKREDQEQQEWLRYLREIEHK